MRQHAEPFMQNGCGEDVSKVQSNEGMVPYLIPITGCLCCVHFEGESAVHHAVLF
jgi:hypothetical protein